VGAAETVIEELQVLSFTNRLEFSIYYCRLKNENSFDSKKIKQFAQKFDQTLFQKRFSDKVIATWDQYHHPLS
jgi:hypothetical protein